MLLTAVGQVLTMHALVLGSKEYPMGTADGSEASPSGGMEIYVDGLVPALSRKGVGLTVVTRSFKGTKKDERRGNVRVVRVPFVSGFFLRNPTFNLMAFLRSLRLDFDVIISNGEIANLSGLLLSRIKRRPVIMVSHGLASEQPQYNPVIRLAFRMTDRLTYPRADAAVTHAPWQLSKITRKYSVIRPGLDRSRLRQPARAERERLRRRYAPDGEKIIVYTGRLMAVKGLEYLIRSLRFVRQRHVCVLVGDGPDMEKCRSLAAEEKANVVFAGFRNDVAGFLSVADAFVLPSLSESLNYSLVEAAYMGVPIVCTDIGIVSGGCAFLAEPRDERSLATAINTALSGKGRAKSANARKYADSFDWDAAAEKYVGIIRRILA
jgi:glycosyltransferase involved in cell wall biosynthesis